MLLVLSMIPSVFVGTLRAIELTELRSCEEHWRTSDNRQSGRKAGAENHPSSTTGKVAVYEIIGGRNEDGENCKTDLICPLRWKSLNDTKFYVSAQER